MEQVIDLGQGVEAIVESNFGTQDGFRVTGQALPRVEDDGSDTGFTVIVLGWVAFVVTIAWAMVG